MIIHMQHHHINKKEYVPEPARADMRQSYRTALMPPSRIHKALEHIVISTFVTSMQHRETLAYLPFTTSMKHKTYMIDRSPGYTQCTGDPTASPI